MATIDITRSHNLTVAEMKTKVTDLSGSLEAKYGVRGTWQGDNMILAGGGMSSGVKGKIALTASSIRIEIDLPFLLRPMKGKVEESVTRKLDRALSGG